MTGVDRPEANDAPRPDSTALAEDRTILAAERTYASWMRTGLAFLSAGLALQRFLRGELPAWELRGLGLVLIACAAACFLASAWRGRTTWRRLRRTDVHLLPTAVTVGASALLGSTMPRSCPTAPAQPWGPPV